MSTNIDAEALARSPLPRRIAIVRDGSCRTYVDGINQPDDEPVELMLLVTEDSAASDILQRPNHDIPMLSVTQAFDLFMPEHMPPQLAGGAAGDDAIAQHWFAGCAATLPGRASLQKAHDILPIDATAERRVLRDAVSRATHLRAQPAAARVISPERFTGPLQESGWLHRDPHVLLDACWEFLRRTSEKPFEQRSGQTEMSHAVLKALLAESSLVVEAATGTGKTLAYALPAVIVSAQHTKRLVLSTHTRNLQQQLTDRDLPWLSKHLGLSTVQRSPDHSGIEYAKLLGRTNYVCRQALQQWIERQRGKSGARLAAQILLALLRSPDGTLEDVLPDLPAHVWSEIHSRRGACVGRRCKGENPCPVYRVRDAARSADILVVNHALLMADARGSGGILGEWHGLVVDEAHHLQQVATESMGNRLGRYPIEAVGRPLSQLQREAAALSAFPDEERWAQRLLEWCDEQRDVQKQLFTWWHELDAALPQRGRVPARQRYLDGAEVFGCLGEPTQELRQTLAAARSKGLQAASALQDVIVEQPQLAEAFDLFTVSLELLEDVAMAFEFLLRGDDEEWTFYLDFSGDDSTLSEIVALPLDVSESLPELLHLDDVGSVFTSATLFMGDDSSWFRRQLGIAAETASLQVASPFDHEKQCLLAQTANLGDWRDADFVPQVAELVADLHARTQRRTMVLLTSRSALHKLDGMLREVLPRSVAVFSQFESVSRSRLAARFAETPGAILLGLASFWEGVDFPRDALELLVIPKLPFLVPNEPLVEARSQRMRAHGEEPFSEFILPEAVLRLRQGFGRLLRTPDDRGAVILLDARLETRAYGGEFLQPLPVPCRTFQDAGSLVDHVAEWLGTAGAVTAVPQDTQLDIFTMPGDLP